jgi:hypothetical protein
METVTQVEQAQGKASMAIATSQPAQGAIKAPQEPFYRGMPSRAHFTPDQQKVFDRAFAKREAKIRGQYERMRKDLFDTCALTLQLLERCGDRMSIEDQRAILTGLNAIRLEYEERGKCQKA